MTITISYFILQERNYALRGIKTASLITLNCSSEEMTTRWGARPSTDETLPVWWLDLSLKEQQLESIMSIPTTGALCFSWISLANWALALSVLRLSATNKINWP